MFEKYTKERNKNTRKIDHNFQVGKITIDQRDSKFGEEFYKSIEPDLNLLSDEFTGDNLPTLLDFYFSLLFKQIIELFGYPQFISLMGATLNDLTENKMKTIKLHINNCKDREAMMLALANAGYKVWREEKKVGCVGDTDLYVCFEVNVKEVK